MATNHYDAPVKNLQLIPAASRVASRYLLAMALDVGKTLQNPRVRIHRYRDSFLITDLTNAGKRGKGCRELHVVVDGDAADSLARSLALKAAGGYDTVLGVVQATGLKTTERQLKGITVEPFGDRFDLKWELPNETIIQLRSSPLDFQLNESVKFDGPAGKPGFRQDTNHWPVKKTDAQLFYRWMLDNSSSIKGMSLQEIKDVWRSLGVKWNEH